MTPLTEWQNFYVIVGSAAGALTGLQFVVMALISDVPMAGPGEHETGEAFASPTVVHFVAVLMLAASLVIPWHSLTRASGVWMLAGVSGLVYTALVVRRMRRQTAYHPVLEDWLFHAVLPLSAYAGLSASALELFGLSSALGSHVRGALFGIAGSALLLLFVGIHNAWDNVLYLVSLKRERLHGQAATEDASS